MGLAVVGVAAGPAVARNSEFWTDGGLGFADYYGINREGVVTNIQFTGLKVRPMKL